MSGFGEAPASAANLGCYVCGRGPAAPISVSRGLGMLVMRRHWTYRAPLCREHGSQLARNWLLATVLMGWWGIISFFVNFGFVATDVRALLAARRLAPPSLVVGPRNVGPDGQVVEPSLPLVAHTRLGLMAGIIVIVLIGYVALNAFGPKDVRSLAVGDCFDPPATSGDISQVTSRPCSVAHTAELFDIVTYSGGSAGTYPTDAELQSFVSSQCGPAAVTYTGGGGGLAATVDIAYLFPNADGWAAGNHTVMCYLEAPTGQTLSQSLRSTSH